MQYQSSPGLKLAIDEMRSCIRVLIQGYLLRANTLPLHRYYRTDALQDHPPLRYLVYNPYISITESHYYLWVEEEA
jgi:hypothetical protein